MKRTTLLALLLSFSLSVVMLFTLSCATTKTITQVESKWGPPAKVEDRGDTIVHYYYFHRGRSTGYVPGNKGGIFVGRSTVGVVVVEITTDREGNILGERKYWKQ